MPPSDISSQDETLVTPDGVQTPGCAEELNVTSSLEGLQTDEQRRVLDTVEQVRKCGLAGTLSLPQLVVCGDQSAGKSSVLEALTEIPFPRNDNLCTRFATEISLRRGNKNTLKINIIPDNARPSAEQTAIKSFQESITDFEELPRIMNLAMAAMGIYTSAESDAKPQAFSRDVLSIVIEGPTRPQLTLVDIPGLIATKTKSITTADVQLVADITDRYISQPRTICLAVVSATNDYANQKILEKVREVDPEGDRTLGIITKPDGLAKGSGSEKAYIELAQNKDIFFQLGWHVVKNRKFEERDDSLEQRNLTEEIFFRASNFKCLPREFVGIDSLRRRLSVLLFGHVKKELPKLRQELETLLRDTQHDLKLLGDRRSSELDCRSYLLNLSIDYSRICQAAVRGHYEEPYFHRNIRAQFSTISVRLRAVIQSSNTQFYNELRKYGHRYQIEESDDDGDDDDESPDFVEETDGDGESTNGTADADEIHKPKEMTRQEALDWVRTKLVESRGQELVGNFNPLVIGELFWEQSSRWCDLAATHVGKVSRLCSSFLKALLQDQCPSDVETRLWGARIEEQLRKREDSATVELEKLKEDLKRYPTNYNHYYTDTISKRRQDRQNAALAKCIEDATTTTKTYPQTTTIDIKKAVGSYSQTTNPDMDNFSCEEALDCLFAIYKVKQKVFVDNVTTQAIERHIISGLERIFSATYVNGLDNSQILRITAEPDSVKKKREHLEDQVSKLKIGYGIFRDVM